MAFEITYWTLGKPAFAAAMRKVNNHGGYKGVKTAYNIARMTSLLEREIKTYRTLMGNLLREHVKQDAKGFMRNEETNEWDFKSEESKEAFKEKFTELHDHKVTIERYKINLSDLEPVGLSPDELIILDPLLNDDLDEEEEKAPE